MSKENAKKVETTPEFNTIFTGKAERWNKETGKLEKVSREAPAFIINGINKIELPESQAKGFYLEPNGRGVIMNLFPQEFKDVQKK